jgi:hypothetical protein
MDISLVTSFELPEPDSTWTVPIGIGLGVVVVLLLIKRIVMIALILAVIAGGVIAYQSGAFDRWVDKGDGTTLDYKLG